MNRQQITSDSIRRTLTDLSDHPIRDPLFRLYRALVSEQAPHLLSLLDAQWRTNGATMAHQNSAKGLAAGCRAPFHRISKEIRCLEMAQRLGTPRHCSGPEPEMARVLAHKWRTSDATQWSEP